MHVIGLCRDTLLPEWFKHETYLWKWYNKCFSKLCIIDPRRDMMADMFFVDFVSPIRMALSISPVVNYNLDVFDARSHAGLLTFTIFTNWLETRTRQIREGCGRVCLGVLNLAKILLHLHRFHRILNYCTIDNTFNAFYCFVCSRQKGIFKILNSRYEIYQTSYKKYLSIYD